MGFRLHSGFDIDYFSLHSDKLLRDVRLVCMSDLHECTHGKDNGLLLDTIKRIDPDYVVIAGDMVDAEKHGDCREVMDFLKKVAMDFPLYFGVGNHERYLLDKDKLPDQKKWFLEGLADYRLKLMRNESEYIAGDNINIVGLDLPRWYFRRSHPELLDIETMEMFLSECDRSRFNILLAHDPDHFTVYSEWGADLVLSGHVHGGVIGLGENRGLISPKLVPLPRYVSGRYHYGESTMIVSRGLGNHTINFRFLNRPELVVVELKIKKDNG